jgi:hypothetical protein
MSAYTPYIKKERITNTTGTYDVTLEETSRERVFPEDEVREILAQAIRKGHMDLEGQPQKYERLFDIAYEIARLALEDMQNRFDVSIKTKRNT